MTEPSAQVSRRERDIKQLRDIVSMLANFIWTKQLRPGEHLWSIPADRERDFDLILSDAIDELEQRRKEASAGSDAPPRWQDISTAPKDGKEILAWRDSRACFMRWRAMEHHPNGGFWDQWHASRKSIEHFQPTHWQPLPSAPVVLRSSEDEPTKT